MSAGARCRRRPWLPVLGIGAALAAAPREPLAWARGNAAPQAERNPASHKMARKTPRSLVEQNGRV